MDAGYGFLLKDLTTKAQDDWLEQDNDIDRWLGNCEKKLKLGVSDRRILITQWVGNAFEKLKSSNYDNFRKNCFQKTGCLITANGSEDEFIKPEELQDYKVFPPMSGPGPEDVAEIKAPEPALEPEDVIVEDDLFTSESSEANLDLESEDGEEEELERIGKSICQFKILPLDGNNHKFK